MDARHCSYFPPALRARSAEILGNQCLSPDGKPYADIQRPSYYWRKKASEPAPAVARVGKIESRETSIRKFLCKFFSFFVVVAVSLCFVLWLFI